MLKRLTQVFNNRQVSGYDFSDGANASLRANAAPMGMETAGYSYRPQPKPLGPDGSTPSNTNLMRAKTEKRRLQGLMKTGGDRNSLLSVEGDLRGERKDLGTFDKFKVWMVNEGTYQYQANFKKG
jgi:hypothetical protein